LRFQPPLACSSCAVCRRQVAGQFSRNAAVGPFFNRVDHSAANKTVNHPCAYASRFIFSPAHFRAQRRKFNALAHLASAVFRGKDQVAGLTFGLSLE